MTESTAREHKKFTPYTRYSFVRLSCKSSQSDPLNFDNLVIYLAVYLPSASHELEEFKECFDYLWALYDFLSADGSMILLGDFNSDLVCSCLNSYCTFHFS